MDEDCEAVLLANEGLVEAIKIVIFSRNEVIVRVFNAKDILKLACLVPDLCLVVDFDRPNVVQLNWETQGLEKTNRRVWKKVLCLLHSQ